MMPFFLNWILWNGILGGFALTIGSLLAAWIKSPIRRLRILEWTLLTALLVPILATAQFPYRWSLKWLPPLATVPSAAAEPSHTDGPAVPDVSETSVASVLPSPSVSGQHDILPAPESIQSDETIASVKTPGRSGRHSFVSFSLLLIGSQVSAVALIVGWWLIGVIALLRLWRKATPATASIQRLLDSICSARQPGSIEVRVGPEVPTACAFGLRRSCILLPQSLVESGDHGNIRFALAHECAHLSRGDLWTWRLTRFAQLLCWFQPAYWWLRHQVRLCQDFLADAEASETGSAVEFAAFLVECARNRLSWPLAAALPLTSRPSDLTRRVTMLIKQDCPLERNCPRGMQVAVAILVAATLSAAALVRVEAQDQPPQTESSPAAQNPPSQKPTDQNQSGSNQTPPTAAAGETLTYHCRVIEHGTEAPIVGATIHVKQSLYGDPRFARNHPLETTTHTTDAEGRYTVVIPAEQSGERYLYIELDVEHPQYMAKRGFGYSMTMTLKNEKLGERPFFETTKLYAAQPVTGRLLSPTGEPAANVKILGYQYPGEKPFDAVDGYTGSFFEEKTDEDGKFALPIVTPGRGAFWFQPDDAAPLGMVAPEGRGDVGDVKLHEGLRVKGIVLDAEGHPVADVDVAAQRKASESPAMDEFNRTSMASGGYRRSAKTNDQGEFELEPVEAGEYEVRVAEYDKEKGSKRFSGVFLNQNIDLAETSGPLEFRALPTVSITAKNVNVTGEPRRGFEFHVFGRNAGGSNWFSTSSTRPADGVGIAEIPKGLTEVQVTFMDNEHGSYRVRREAGAELEEVRDIKLGTVDADVNGIEVVRYKAPVILLKVVDADGTVIEGFKVMARHISAKAALQSPEPADKDETDPPGFVSSDINESTRSEVNFERQQDGRWRSGQLLPDRTFSVTILKEDWKTDPQEVSLPEGDERELVFVMQPQ